MPQGIIQSDDTFALIAAEAEKHTLNGQKSGARTSEPLNKAVALITETMKGDPDYIRALFQAAGYEISTSESGRIFGQKLSDNWVHLCAYASLGDKTYYAEIAPDIFPLPSGNPRHPALFSVPTERVIDILAFNNNGRRYSHETNLSSKLESGLYVERDIVLPPARLLTKIAENSLYHLLHDEAYLKTGTFDALTQRMAGKNNFWVATSTRSRREGLVYCADLVSGDIAPTNNIRELHVLPIRLTSAPTP